METGAKITEVIDDIDPVILAEREGINAVLPAAQRPDDGDVMQTATPITMNEIINARIEEYGDTDWFSFDSFGPGQDGVLEVILEEMPGEAYISDIDLVAIFPTGGYQYLPEIITSMGGYFGFGYGFGFGGTTKWTFDLREITRPGISYALYVAGDQLNLGDYKLTIKNDIVLARLQAQEALENIGKIDSLVNSYPITRRLVT